MFDILFGWRKASKCKKLIKRVQCRLKLLKNKRCSIARQLREDVAQLLKLGHDQTAFDRVEQLFKDESIVAVYDLLDHFCEFINIHLSYIRRHKDCPNDINEAVSSLIFASARCGDLPELPVIRKLFGERYGERFAKAALELLPGNLVNGQIRENLSIKSVPAEVKYRLVDQIARSCLPIGPLALEYNFTEPQELLANKSNDDQVPNSDVRTSYNRYEESQSDPSNIIVAEGKTVHVDTSSEGNKISTPPHLSPNTLESSVQERCKDGGMVEESPSESSIHMQEEMIYLDDVEEFQSPISKDGHDQDQRLFMFKSPVIPAREKIEGGYYKDSRRSRKSRKVAGKRLRNPSFSWETNRSVKDGECDKLWHENCKSPHPRKHQKKLQMEGSQISYCEVEILDHHCCKIGSSFNCEMMVNNCSLEHPCYVCVSDDKDSLRRSPWQPKRRSESLEHFPPRDLKEETVQYGIYYCQCSCNGELKNQHPYLRAMTMPTERPKENGTDNILRSNSFPFREPNASSPHVHPKMPDYDELAAKFMALKRENLQNKHQ